MAEKPAILSGVLILREDFENFRITTKGDAIKFLHLKSIMSAKNIGERLASEAKDHLLNNCVECEVYESDGLSVKKITPKTRIYKQTPEIKKWEDKMEKLKADLAHAKEQLELAQNKAGFTEEDGNSYFKVVT